MKTTIQILSKVVLLVLFFTFTPFMQGLQSMVMNETMVDRLVYTNPDIDNLDIKNNLNVMSVPKVNLIETPAPLPETEQVEAVEVPPNEIIGKIYIYNTHQEEAYVGGLTVYNAALELAARLREKGYEVIVEEADFLEYGRSNDLDYNKSYQISRKFLTDAIMEAGGFDLIIDFHRDSIPRENTYLTANAKDYAKMMVVIGGLTDNSYEIEKRASTLFDKCNEVVHGIMKNTMTREAYYNQDMSDKMMLIEVGSENNTFEEIRNSVDVLAEGIVEMLG